MKTHCNNDPDKVSNLYAESGQTLQGSFSAVSKPNFASKYALESSRRDLHKALLCTALKSHFFLIARILPKIIEKFAKFQIFRIFFNLLKFEKFSKQFGEIWKKIEIADLCKIVHFVDLDESFQTHIFLQILASIQPRTSPPQFDHFDH